MDHAQAPRLTLLDGFVLERPGTGTAAPELPRGAQRLIAHLGLGGRLGRCLIAGQL